MTNTPTTRGSIAELQRMEAEWTYHEMHEFVRLIQRYRGTLRNCDLWRSAGSLGRCWALCRERDRAWLLLFVQIRWINPQQVTADDAICRRRNSSSQRRPTSTRKSSSFKSAMSSPVISNMCRLRLIEDRDESTRRLLVALSKGYGVHGFQTL